MRPSIKDMRMESILALWSNWTALVFRKQIREMLSEEIESSVFLKKYLLQKCIKTQCSRIDGQWPEPSQYEIQLCLGLHNCFQYLGTH